MSDEPITPETPVAEPAAPAELPPPASTPPAVVELAEPLPEPTEKKWYVVKIQSGREDSIRDAVMRRVKIEGLEDYISQIVVPVEKTTEMVKGKKVTRTRKLYPGYLFVEVAFNDKILYLFRETPGVGDFVGAGPSKKPMPMADADVQKILQQKEEVVAKPQPAKIRFERGEHVKVKDGMFAGMEGDVKEILEAKGLVQVMLKIFGREVPVELEYWQIEHA
jgi:transcriptional antiterminator NusG